MEHNLPVVTKKMWSMIRVVFFMLRKGIAKNQLILDLNMMIKRSKIAGKAMIGNLMFHNHHHGSNSRRYDINNFTASHEYEFSCSNSPAFPFHLTKRGRRRHHGSNKPFFACAYAPPTPNEYDMVTLNTVKNVLEKLNNVEASPMLPGFGKSPMVRQLRITDSPFPLQEVEEYDVQVDKAADEFIKKFYMQLNQQKNMYGEGY